MKQTEKSILIVVIIILVAVIASGATYIVMSSKKENNNQTNSNQTDEKQPTISLTEDQLKDYLSYIPYNVETEGNVYSYQKVNVNQIKQEYLLGRALGYLYAKCEPNTCFYDETLNIDDGLTLEGYEALKKDEALKMLQKMYNISNITMNSTHTYDYIAYDGGTCYYFINDKFIVNNCVGDFDKLSHITNYEATNNDLIIYEVVADFSGLQPSLQDYYTKKEIKLDYDVNDPNWENKVINYFENNLTNFTEYKHTFKKNATGYYWYSTEINKGED